MNTITIDKIREPVEEQLFAVEQALYDNLATSTPLVTQVASHLMDNGGKRLRPLLMLLTNKACSYNGEGDIPLATAIEYIHTATLLHDDVVDSSEMRRGQPAAHKKWGNAASILVGDFLYSRAFQLMVKHSDQHILSLFAAATSSISEGEVQQLSNRHRTDLSETQYLDVLRSKTGKLFEVAAEVGVLLCGNEVTTAEESMPTSLAMRHFGMHLGTAFQLIDDVLDYRGNLDEIGKNVGDDLAKGSATLPLLYALAHGDNATKPLIESAIVKGNIDDLATIQKVIMDCGALDYTMTLAQRECAHAKNYLQYLEDSTAKQSLVMLCDFAIDRIC